MILLKLETKIQPAIYNVSLWYIKTFATHPNYKEVLLVDSTVKPISTITLIDEATYCRCLLKGISINQYILIKPLKPFFRTKVKILLKGLFKWS